MLAPMPIAISMGIGSNAAPTNVMTIQNINGQAIVLAVKHKANRDRRTGRVSSLPSRSILDPQPAPALLPRRAWHQSRYRRAAACGAPPEMVANLRAGNIDGFLGPIR